MTKDERIFVTIYELCKKATEFGLPYDYFLNGKCYVLSKLLCSIFDNAETWYNGDHFVTEINGKLWDANGLVEPKGYLHLEDVYTLEYINRKHLEWLNIN